MPCWSQKTPTARSIRTPRPAFDTQPALPHRPSLDRTAAQTERTRRRCSSDTNHYSAEALQPLESAQIHRRPIRKCTRNAHPTIGPPAANSPLPRPYGPGAGAAHRATTQKRATNAQPWRRVGPKTQRLATARHPRVLRQHKCRQSKRKRYRDRWSSRTPEPALRGGQDSETRAAGCVAPRELARGNPSHPLHRRIQSPNPEGSGRMLCSLATNGLR